MPWRDLNDEDVEVLLHGHIAFQMLACACELGLFDYLSEHPGATLEDTAAAVELTAYPFGVLLGGLRTLGLVIDDAGALSNAPAAQQLLTTASADNRTALLGVNRHLAYPAMGDLLASLQRATNVGVRHFPGPGDNLYERLAVNPALERVLHDGLRQLSNAVIDDLVSCDVLAHCHHLLDIGGGDAANALALAQAHPKLAITIVDRPSVLELAATRLGESPHAAQIMLHAADFLTDPLPPGADAVLLAHVLPIFPPAINRDLLARIHDALEPGGKILIFNTMQQPTEDGSVMAMLYSAYFLTLASGQGRYYPGTQVEQWLTDTGFVAVERHEGMPYSHAIVTGTKR